MRLHSRTALLCHEYLHKTHAPQLFDIDWDMEESEIIKEFKRQGQIHEETVIDYLLSLEGIRIQDLRNVSGREHATAVALLSSDVDIILGAYIGDECEKEICRARGTSSGGDPLRVSRPDLLVRVGMSSLGTPLWAPVDIKSHSAFGLNKSNSVRLSRLEELSPFSGVEENGRISQEDAFQLAHYFRHLESLGLANEGHWVGIIGRDYEECAWSILDKVFFGVGAHKQDAVTSYDSAFLEARRIIGLAQARNENPSLPPPTMPQLFTGKFGCAGCEFKDVCEEEMNEFGNGSGHVTLLATVTPDKAKKHFPTIQSIGELVEARDLSPFGMTATLRAQVWLDEIPRLIDPAAPLTIPEFDIEVDIDLENSQAALQEIDEDEVVGRDQVYLYGYGVHDRGASSDWRSADFQSIWDYSNSLEGELEVLLKMWRTLEEIVESAHKANKTVGVFHYSHHERTWWRKFGTRYAGLPGVPTEDHIEEFMDKYFVDLLPVARLVAFPTSGYSIKSLAPLADFDWEVDEAGGAMSLVKYKSAVSRSSSPEERADAIEWLRAYNLDDVRATFAVRDYLRNLQL